LIWLHCLPDLAPVLARINPYLSPSFIGTYHNRPLPSLLGNTITVGWTSYIATIFVLNIVFLASGYKTLWPQGKMQWYEDRYQEVIVYSQHASVMGKPSLYHHPTAILSRYGSSSQAHPETVDAGKKPSTRIIGSPAIHADAYTNAGHTVHPKERGDDVNPQMPKGLLTLIEGLYLTIPPHQYRKAIIC
jgi:hypothetical protein